MCTVGQDEVQEILPSMWKTGPLIPSHFFKHQVWATGTIRERRGLQWLLLSFSFVHAVGAVNMMGIMGTTQCIARAHTAALVQHAQGVDALQQPSLEQY